MIFIGALKVILKVKEISVWNMGGAVFFGTWAQRTVNPSPGTHATFHSLVFTSPLLSCWTVLFWEGKMSLFGRKSGQVNKVCHPNTTWVVQFLKY